MLISLETPNFLDCLYISFHTVKLTAAEVLLCYKTQYYLEKPKTLNFSARVSETAFTFEIGKTVIIW